MNWYDILIIVLLAAAAVQGWRQGVVVQVLGLAAIVAGIFLAREYSAGSVVWSIAIFVGVLLVVALIGRLARGLFRVVGMGIFDSILGAAFGALKVFILAWLVLRLFDVQSIFNVDLLWVRDLWAR